MDIKIPAPGRAIFAHLQFINDRVYGIQNGRIYSPEQMCMKIMRYSTRAIKGIRKGKAGDIRNGIIMAFSWAMALSQRLQIDLDVEVWKRFPGVCPYCGTSPCSCGERAVQRRVSSDTLPKDQNIERPISVVDFQEMFLRIYPKNTLKDAGIHLAEESAELLEAYMDFAARHTDQDFEEVLVELVDVITNLFAVANTIVEIVPLPISIAHDYCLTFRDGCPKCHLPSCKCGFTITADSVTLPSD